jgi:flagellar M-ring protein FliF
MRFIAADLPGHDSGEETAPAGYSWPLLAGVAGPVVVVCLGAALFLFKRRRHSGGATPAALIAPEPSTRAVAGPAPEQLLLANEDTSTQRMMIAALHRVVDTRPDEALAVIRTWIAEGEPA